MSRNKPGGEIDLSLSVKGIEQRGVDRLPIPRKVAEVFAMIPWNTGRRQVEIAREIKRHCAM